MLHASYHEHAATKRDMKSTQRYCPTLFALEVFLYKVTKAYQGEGGGTENSDPVLKIHIGEGVRSGGQGVAIQFLDYPLLVMELPMSTLSNQQQKQVQRFYSGKRCIFSADIQELQFLLSKVSLYLFNSLK